MPSIYIVIFADDPTTPLTPMVLIGTKNNESKFWGKISPQPRGRFVRNNPMQQVFPGGNPDEPRATPPRYYNLGDVNERFLAAGKELEEETGNSLTSTVTPMTLTLPATTTIPAATISLISSDSRQLSTDYATCFLEVSLAELIQLRNHITSIIADDNNKVLSRSYGLLCRHDDELFMVDIQTLPTYQANLAIIPFLPVPHHRKPYQRVDWFKNITTELALKIQQRQQLAQNTFDLQRFDAEPDPVTRGSNLQAAVAAVSGLDLEPATAARYLQLLTVAQWAVTSHLTAAQARFDAHNFNTESNPMTRTDNVQAAIDNVATLGLHPDEAARYTQLLMATRDAIAVHLQLAQQQVHQGQQQILHHHQQQQQTHEQDDAPPHKRQKL